MFRKLLTAEWAPFGVLSEDQLSKLEYHYELLMRWNSVLNLTRIQQLEEVVRLHYCESLFLGSMLPAGVRAIVDVGSGAGFPGVPVAVLRPECAVALVESHQRKAVFLTEACQVLPNASVMAVRAESAGGSYDWVVSRAVASPTVLALNQASSIAILTSEAELLALPNPTSVIPLPWGKQRIIAMFHVEQLGAKI
jgi:16S rRNA (guanine527-N7)-methyltransferase